MLQNTNFWETGRLDLYLNNEPTKAYVPKEDVKRIFELSQQRIADDGKIPIGIDHLPEEVIKANPILDKLDLLHVGDITAVEYDNRNNTVKIREATLTNPLIKQLYDDGKLDAVSIVSQVKARPCPNNDEIKIIDTQSIDRVDIVGVGACESCTIPKPSQGSNDMVYARKPLQKEEDTMADELTIEQIEELFDKKFEEKLEPITERIEKLEKAEPSKPAEETGDDEVKARLAKLEKEAVEAKELAKVEAANAKVDLAIQAGKIKPADRESMVAFAKSASEKFDAYIKEADVIVPLGARQSQASGEGSDPTDDDEDKALIEEVNNAYNKGE